MDLPNKEICAEKSTPISPTFCILPWIHVSTKTNGEMRLCCTTCASSADKTNNKKYGGKLGVNLQDTGAPANLNNMRLLDGWNNQFMRKVRLQMLRGEKPVPCSKCFKEEASGVQSKRMWETQYWSERMSLEQLIMDTRPDGSVPEKIYYMDLRLGHQCNLKCVMCSPHDSSRWIHDWHRLYPTTENPELRELLTWTDEGRTDGASYNWHRNPHFWEDLYQQIPHLKQLYFAGGEPMLIREHLELLRECVKRGHSQHIELRYNSNGTILKDEVLGLWSQFKRVRFGFSMDCVGDKNYYIRYPSSWKTVLSNLRKLDDTASNVEVTLACAVQAINMYYIPEFIQWKIEQCFKKVTPWPLGAGLINFHFVYHPAHLNVKVLPAFMKEQIARRFDAFYDWLIKNYRNDGDFVEHPYGIRRLKNMVNFMKSEDWSNRVPQFQEYIQRLDSIRKTCFENYFPELKELLVQT